MNRPQKFLVLYVLFFLLAVFFTFSQKEAKARVTFVEDSESDDMTREVANQMEIDSYFEFKLLPQSEKMNLKDHDNLIHFLKRYLIADIDKIYILSWGNLEFPSDIKNRTGNAEEQLVDRRLEYIANEIKVFHDNFNILTVSMAKTILPASKKFDFEENLIKKYFLSAGMPTTEDALAYPSKADHCIIMVKLL